MGLFIEVPADVYERIAARAEREGYTPSRYAGRFVRLHLMAEARGAEMEAEKAAKTAAERGEGTR